MKVDKATAKYMLEVSEGWDSNADIGGEEVEEAFTAGYKQGRIEALGEFKRGVECAVGVRRGESESQDDDGGIKKYQDTVDKIIRVASERSPDETEQAKLRDE